MKNKNNQLIKVNDSKSQEKYLNYKTKSIAHQIL